MVAADAAEAEEQEQEQEQEEESDDEVPPLAALLAEDAAIHLWLTENPSASGARWHVRVTDRTFVHVDALIGVSRARNLAASRIVWCTASQQFLHSVSTMC